MKTRRISGPVLRTSPIIGFVPTQDFRRAQRFYGGKLGLEFVSHDAFALVFKIAGSTLRVARIQEFTPSPFTILGWHVADLARAAAALKKRGVRFERFPGLEQDKLGIWDAPGGARVAWFKDPDGNVLSLSQHP
jgi:catechol 2,3-dioxygenase-like lactoylglutathione lyase family enzyme